jgi:hypothetical protein
VPVPVAVEKVEVTLTSSPEGASVQRNGELLGTTPFTVLLKEGEEMAVEVTAAGHASQTIVLSTGVPSPKVTLTRRRARPTSKPAPKPEPVPEPEPVAEDPPAPVPQPTPKPAYDGVDMKDPGWGDE